MKITMHGDAVVITSAIKTEVLEMVSKYNPGELTLFEEVDNKKNPVFKLGVGCEGSFNKNGIIFDNQNAEGYAQTTIVANPVVMTAEERVELFASEFARTIDLANTLETKIARAAESIQQARTVAKESIEVL